MIRVEVDLTGFYQAMDIIRGVVPAGTRAMTRYINDYALPEFQSTTKTWKHSVDFKHSVTTKATLIEGKVSTDDEIYVLVNEGAKRHDIAPKTAKFLAFQPAYTPKTKPRWLGSQSGGGSGPYAFAKFVDHPGFKGRAFDETVAEKASKQIIDLFREELAGI